MESTRVEICEPLFFKNENIILVCPGHTKETRSKYFQVTTRIPQTWPVVLGFTLGSGKRPLFFGVFFFLYCRAIKYYSFMKQAVWITHKHTNMSQYLQMLTAAYDKEAK